MKDIRHDKQRIKALEDALKYVLTCVYKVAKDKPEFQDALDQSSVVEPTGQVRQVLEEIGTKVKQNK